MFLKNCFVVLVALFFILVGTLQSVHAQSVSQNNLTIAQRQALIELLMVKLRELQYQLQELQYAEKAKIQVNEASEFGLHNVNVNKSSVKIGDPITISWEYDKKPDPKKYGIYITVSGSEKNSAVPYTNIQPPSFDASHTSYTWPAVNVGPWQNDKSRYFKVILYDKSKTNALDSYVAQVTSQNVNLVDKKSDSGEVRLILPQKNAIYSTVAPIPVQFTAAAMTKDWIIETYLLKPDGTELFINNYYDDGAFFWTLTPQDTGCYIGTCNGYGVRLKQIVGSLKPLDISFKNQFSVTSGTGL